MARTQVRRRQFLLAGAALTASPWALGQGTAKTVKILVGFPAGQATDAVARLMAESLRGTTAQSYIVENRPGQGGSIALSELARAPADGSVMMLAHMSAVCTNPHLYKRVSYDSLKDFEAVGLVGDLPFVLVCHAALPIQNVQDLIAYAKANPDKLSNASSGNGTVSHLAMEEFKRRAGISIVHVPYKGSVPGLTDVAAGNVSIALETAAGVAPLIQSGKLRPLAVGTSRRLEGMPNVPTMQEQGLGDFDAATWLMVLYPRGVRKELVHGTFEAMRTSLRTPSVELRLIASNCLPRYSVDPGTADSYLRAEYAKWGEVVRRSGVKLEG
jgi:tripartite-type tricarboxylate transporter receptor subunit TctC